MVNRIHVMVDNFNIRYVLIKTDTVGRSGTRGTLKFRFCCEFGCRLIHSIQKPKIVRRILEWNSSKSNYLNIL